MAEPLICPTCSSRDGLGNFSVKIVRGKGNCADCVRAERQELGLADGATPGSRDGSGAGDHDTPYFYGRVKSYLVSLPARDMARLLILRGRVQDRRIAAHTTTPDPDGL